MYPLGLRLACSPQTCACLDLESVDRYFLLFIPYCDFPSDLYFVLVVSSVLLKKYIQFLDRLLPSLAAVPFFYAVVFEFKAALEEKLSPPPSDPASPLSDSP